MTDDKLLSIRKEKEELASRLAKIKQEEKERQEQLKEEKSYEKKKNNNNGCANKLIRVSNKFDEELDKIQEERIDTGVDETKTSKPKLTGLIVKHNFWSKVKEDLVMFKFPKMNKKGQTTLFVGLLILILFVGLIFLYIGGVITVRMNTALSQDVDIGDVNLANITASTWGKFTTAYLNNADWWGIAMIFGSILGLFLSAFFLRGKFPKWGMVLDIFIIIAMFVLSLYISSSYRVMVNSLSSAGETFLEVYTPKTSAFMLNLPIFVVIISVIMMVLFHSSIPRRRTLEGQQPGLLQGA